jgi:hypothetical protein
MEDQPLDQFSKWIKLLYKNKTFDQLLTDVLLAMLIFLLYSFAFVYFKLKKNKLHIRENWNTYKCNPAYMPFAGAIMEPSNMTELEYVQENFQYCFQNVLKEIVVLFLNPLYYTQSVAGNLIAGIARALNQLRELINLIRSALSSVMAEIFGRSLNVMNPIILIIISVRDIIGKILGVITAYLYTIYGAYQTLVSGLKSIFQLIVIILIIMGAVIVAAWIALAIALIFGPFGVPAAIAATTIATVTTAIFVAIAIPLGFIAHFLARTLRVSGLSVIPGVPKKK